MRGSRSIRGFMVKDSKRFADSGGWGYAVFDYNAAADTFTPGTTAGTPPQGNDAKCGFACHHESECRPHDVVRRWLHWRLGAAENQPGTGTEQT